jgi:hypothetical protein
VADIDGDGDPDLAGSAEEAHQVLWWENMDGTGTSWTEWMVAPDHNAPREIRARDIDGDGYVDLVVAGQMGYPDGTVCWFENPGPGTLWDRHDVLEEQYNLGGIDAADINGDGYVDILKAGDGEFSWLENMDGSGLLWENHCISSVYMTMSIHAADFHGDSIMDVVAGTYATNGKIWWFRNEDGQGTSWEAHTIEGEACLYLLDVWADDLDLDGDLDVVSSSHTHSLRDTHRSGADSPATWIRWYDNLNGYGTSWKRRYIALDFDSPKELFTGDFDQDGEVDVLSASFNASGISWWSVTDYSEGHLESSIMHAIVGTDWESIDWSCSEPGSTSVSFQLRASSDPDDMGPWSDTLSGPCSLEGVVGDGRDWIQYRAILETDLPETGPELEDVTVFWNPLGVGESGSQPPPGLLPVSPNPAPGYLNIGFRLPEPTSVRISVYDMCGRRVFTRFFDAHSPGEDSVRTGPLETGAYICRMTSDGRSDVARAVVLR